MTVAVTTLRSTIASALTDNALWQVFSFPPASPLANSIIVQCDDPYLVPSNNQHITIAPMVNFKLIVLAPMFDNKGNLINIEDFYVAIMTKLAASNLVYNIGSFSAPAVLQGSVGELLSGEVSLSILTTWS